MGIISRSKVADVVDVNDEQQRGEDTALMDSSLDVEFRRAVVA